MDPVDVMLIVALGAATVVSGVAVWALRESVASMRSIRRTSDEVRERAVPLLDKLDVTVDAANVELLRIDAIITTLEDATERVSSASGTISGIVNVPSEVFSDVLSRLRRGRSQRRRTESSVDTPDEDQTVHTPDQGATPDVVSRTMEEA
ncbi:MAG: hypothetical protein U1E26_04255 [Coriobacteriia bacterium]|nr:hypothetical protein [Coriobacteriia bacterium]